MFSSSMMMLDAPATREPWGLAAFVDADESQALLQPAGNHANTTSKSAVDAGNDGHSPVSLKSLVKCGVVATIFCLLRFLVAGEGSNWCLIVDDNTGGQLHRTRQSNFLQVGTDAFLEPESDESDDESCGCDVLNEVYHQACEHSFKCSFGFGVCVGLAIGATTGALLPCLGLGATGGLVSTVFWSGRLGSG